MILGKGTSFQIRCIPGENSWWVSGENEFVYALADDNRRVRNEGDSEVLEFREAKKEYTGIYKCGSGGSQMSFKIIVEGKLTYYSFYKPASNDKS